MEYDYGDTGAVMAAVEKSPAVRRGERYGERAALVLDVPEAGVEALGSRLRDGTSGRAEMRPTGEAVLVPEPDAS